MNSSPDENTPTGEHEIELWEHGSGKHKRYGFRCSCGRRHNGGGNPSLEQAWLMGNWHAVRPESDLWAVTMAWQALATMRAVRSGRASLTEISVDYAQQLTEAGVLVEDLGRRTCHRGYGGRRMFHERHPVEPLRLTAEGERWLAEREDFEAWKPSVPAAVRAHEDRGGA